ncbi:MAG: hypothetical protein ABR551_08025 [Gemmatimonadales bacterium]
MSGWLVLTAVLLTPVTGWLAVTLHELGHWAGAMLVRFRTLIVVVWPLRITRQGERLQIGTVWNLSFIGGMVACMPTDTRHLRRRMAVLTAGGPLTSLVTGSVAVLAAAVWRGAAPAGWPGQLGLILLSLFGVVSLLVGLSSLWPRETAGYRSDGARLRALAGGGAGVDQEFAAMTLSALSLTGARPREWNADLVLRAARTGDDPLLALAGQHLAWAWHLDHERLDDARVALDRVLEGVDRLPAEISSSMLLDAAWFRAWHDHDPAGARELLGMATSTLLTSAHEKPLAEATIAFREGDHATARARLDDAERLLPKALDRGQALVAVERIAVMREEARREKQAARKEG